MSNETKYLFNLSLAQQEVVYDFAYDAVRLFCMGESHANCKVWLQEQAERITRQHSQECWEACNYVFWRLVSAFGTTHAFTGYLHLEEGVDRKSVKQFLLMEGK